MNNYESFGRRNSRVRKKGRHSHKYKNKPWQITDGDFRCRHCKQMVLVTSVMGTMHRNHCNYCLWSLHVDTKPGNRQCVCHGQMKPIGLTTKNCGFDKYGRPKGDDIMIIHMCQSCDHININRIAADDSDHVLYSIFRETEFLSNEILDELSRQNIDLLESSDEEKLRTALYGKHR